MKIISKYKMNKINKHNNSKAKIIHKIQKKTQIKNKMLYKIKLIKIK